jgi:hypothetical protein
VSHKDLLQPTKDNISQTSKRTRKMIKTSQFGNIDDSEKIKENLEAFMPIAARLKKGLDRSLFGFIQKSLQF